MTINIHVTILYGSQIVLEKNSFVIILQVLNKTYHKYTVKRLSSKNVLYFYLDNKRVRNNKFERVESDPVSQLNIDIKGIQIIHPKDNPGYFKK